MNNSKTTLWGCAARASTRLSEKHTCSNNGPPPEGDFDINKDVFKGHLVAFDELVALQNPESKVDIHDIEDEDD